MDDMSFLLLIKSLSDSEGYCKITDLINNSNCPEMEVWSHIRELDKRKLICAFLEEVQLLPDAFSYLSKAKQERKEKTKAKSVHVAAQIFKWFAGIAATVLAAFLIYLLGLN